MGSRADFLEIEHKFVVEPDFDVDAFRATARALGPTHATELRVEDAYYVSALDPSFVVRHRMDAERQELSIKSRGGADAEVRTEVNLRLDSSGGSQGPAVAAFLSALRVAWQGTITKDIVVFYYADCEVVYYRAVAAGRELHCVEFEFVGPGDATAARATLAAFEGRFGFMGRDRATRSLFELLLLPGPAGQPGAAGLATA